MSKLVHFILCLNEFSFVQYMEKTYSIKRFIGFSIELFHQLKKEGKYVIIASHDERIIALADKRYNISNFKFELVQDNNV